MKKNCTLIATLPALNNLDNVHHVFANPNISEVRFNTGAQTPMEAQETMEILLELSNKYQKKLWIDIKGRQLRVAKWADPLYSCIELNHDIEFSHPAKIYFRNDDATYITDVVDGNKVFVDPLPKYALGAGQSVNIISKGLKVKGYLTPKDEDYLLLCRKLGVSSIMASFVENVSDLVDIHHILPNAEIVSKIESLKGIKFITRYKTKSLMAARDDLYLETGENYDMLKHLQTIIRTDPGAICASRIFLSLQKHDTVDFADFADLELMYRIGYRRFMLCDNICNYRFDKAISAWEDFIYG